MSKLQSENLFLLEFLVEDVNLTNAAKCTCQQSVGEYCVSFSFLDNVDLEICEKDFNPDKKFGTGNERIGKSCMFSLTPEQATIAMQGFNLDVQVIKKKSSTEKTVIGQCLIFITNLLVELLQSKEESPAATVLQESYPLMDSAGAQAGTINVYVRMSCYGKMIITQFQMNLKDKTVLFKDKEGRSLYRYKKSKRKSRETKIEDASQDQTCVPNCPNFKDKQQSQAPFRTDLTAPGAGYPSPNPNCPTQPCITSPGGQASPPAFPPPNPNCPSQPCYPSGMMGQGMMGQGMMGPGMMGPGMMGQGMMGPGMMGQGMMGSCMMGPGMMGQGMMNPGMMGGGFGANPTSGCCAAQCDFMPSGGRGY